MLLPHLGSVGKPCLRSAQTSFIDCTGNSGYRELVQFDPWQGFQNLSIFSCSSHTSDLSRPLWVSNTDTIK